MSLEENIQKVKENIATAAREVGRDPAEITLVAATKVQSDETIRAAIAAGVTICGENRVQEMTAHLDADAYAGAEVHFIGHLQTNQVGSEHLLEAIDKQAAKLGIVQDVLLEVNVGDEESKSGVAVDELEALARRACELPNIRLRGLMAIPPVAGEDGNRGFFREMHQLFVDIKRKMAHNENDINCLSMGMSGDYMDAVREGATLVRVGTALFGARPSMRPAAE